MSQINRAASVGRFRGNNPLGELPGDVGDHVVVTVVVEHCDAAPNRRGTSHPRARPSRATASVRVSGMAVVKHMRSEFEYPAPTANARPGT